MRRAIASDKPSLSGGTAFSLEGSGFATGEPCRLEFALGEPNKGWVVSAPGHAFSIAGPGPDGIDSGGRCTTVRGVGPLEHLCAASVVLGARGWTLSASGADLPLFDGSALPWVECIGNSTAAGGVLIGACPPGGPWSVQGPRGCVTAEPSVEFELDVTWTDGPDGPERWRGGSMELAGLLGARTFARADDWWRARSRGLLLGVGPGNGRLFAPADGRIPREAEEELERAGVDRRGRVWTGGDPRCPDECAAHKALDLVGDIAVAMGYLPAIRITARDAGHPLHAELGRALRGQGKD